MNHIYGLVWNRALKVLQVASELARSHGGASTGGARSPAKVRLSFAISLVLAVSALWVALPAGAATCPTVSVVISGTGSAGTPGSAGYTAGNGGSGYTYTSSGAGPLCVAYGSTVTGGEGGTGGYNANGNGSYGGQGGSGVSGNGFALTNLGTINGGKGGTGGAGSLNGYGNGYGYGSGTTGSGGYGGKGGAGVSGDQFTLTNAGSIAGGVGGTGGAGSANPDGAGANGGYGGEGGAGVEGDGFVLTNTANITGGAGGSGGLGGAGSAAGGNGSYGGTGGAGVDGTGFTLTNTGTISGGAGGVGGLGGYGGTGSQTGTNGMSGPGGVGVTGAGFTLTNAGHIEGGAGGMGVAASSVNSSIFAVRSAYAARGAGVSGHNFTLVNNGYISGGNGAEGGIGIVSTGGSTVVDTGMVTSGTNTNNLRNDAVYFSGGHNALTLEIGASVTGDIVSTSGSGTNGDQLIFADNASGGGVDIFGLSAAVTGFMSYEKTGSGTWVVSEIGVGDWDVIGGTLVLDSVPITGYDPSFGIPGVSGAFHTEESGTPGTPIVTVNSGAAIAPRAVLFGGNGGDGGYNDPTASYAGGPGGAGGAGGAGLVMAEGASLTTSNVITGDDYAGNGSRIFGGQGGNGGGGFNGGAGGSGGTGGSGVIGNGFYYKSSFFVVNGGDGGAGGSGNHGTGGMGGAGAPAVTGNNIVFNNEQGVNWFGGSGGSGGTGTTSTTGPTGPTGGLGGSGGDGFRGSDTSIVVPNVLHPVAIYGGSGGSGGAGAYGGQGGNGGAAVAGHHFTLTVSGYKGVVATGIVVGGSGGFGGNGYRGGSGGVGGSGVAGSDFSVINTPPDNFSVVEQTPESIGGGDGGGGGRNVSPSGQEGAGGAGGYGIGGNNFSVINSGYIYGGHGGSGGDGAGYGFNMGRGGDGGDGIAGSGFTLTNTGHVIGGIGGSGYGPSASGGAGVGITGGSVSVTNGGFIVGGVGGMAVLDPTGAGVYKVGTGGTGGTGMAGLGFVLLNSGHVDGGAGGSCWWDHIDENAGAGGNGLSGSYFQVTNTGVVSGGGGGNGFDSVYDPAGGDGGAGGVGVGGAGFVFSNGGQVDGGNGGAGGEYYQSLPAGNGGNGGVGVSGSAFEFTNSQGATIAGGNGGVGGAGGGSQPTGVGGSGAAGLVSTSGSNVINAGAIDGGLADGGTGVQADAVDFSGGGNTLTLENGYSFGGNVVSRSGATADGDTLALGGDSTGTGATGDGMFNVSDIVAALPPSVVAGTTYYIGLNQFAKTGDSTWVLSGSGANNGAVGENWTIVDGVLQGDATTFTGDLTFAPQTGDAASVVFDQGSGNANSPTTATYAGVITGAGSMAKIDDGTLILTGANTYSGDTDVNAGTLQVGDGSAAGAIGSGDITDNGLLVFDVSSSPTVGGAISGSGSLVQEGAGTLTLDGNSETFAGSSTVQSGALVVGDTTHASAILGGNVTVDGGATLGGDGAVGGSVDVLGGGMVAPGDSSIGTLTVDGDFTAAQGSVLNYELGTPAAAPNQFMTAGEGDSVQVAGNLVLSGVTLNIADAGGMGPGLYNVFSYGGTLTESNGGIELGTIPAGSELQLQMLSSQRQINLIDATGYHLNFWNANGQATATQTGGGSGTWSATSREWTDAMASVPNQFMMPQPGFAMFGGEPGVVTVDDSNGSVTATGMQFAVNGYALQGDTLTLVAGSGGSAPLIRVGNGSSAGAGITATIGSVITGTAGLTKADYGTLVLTAANTFSGGMTISGGTVEVGNDQALGANAVSMESGTALAFAASSLSLANTFALTGNPAFDVASGQSDTVSGVITDGTGEGTLQKTGNGTLVLNGVNTFSGGAAISAGTLAVGDNTSLGAGAVDMAAGTTLSFAANGMSLANAFALNGDPAFDVAPGQTDTVSGVIADGTAPGTLQKTGGGTLALTANDAYSGGTMISAGTLQVGNGGSAGSITGDVANSGMLVFDRSDAVTYAGSISGNGNLTKSGEGALTLTGANTFSGSTTISAGTLQVGNGGTTGTIGTGAITDNGTLVFDRSDAVALPAGLTGTGSLVQQGSGTFTVNGDDGSFAGTTTVKAGMFTVGDDSHADASLGGMVTIAKGATLAGIGSIGGMDLFGTLSPGGSMGTLQVTGDATFESGSTFNVYANPDGQADQLAVTGETTIKGGNTLVIAQPGDWSPQTTYTIITSGKGVIGTFTGVSDDQAFLTPTLAYGADEVSLTLARNQVSFPSVGTMPNQKSVAAGVEGLGSGRTLYDAVVKLTGSEAEAAFTQLSGEYHASQQTARVEDSRYVREAMNQHLRAGDDDPEVAKVGDTKLTAWVHAWGHWGTVNSDGNAGKLADNGDGLLIGADLLVGAQGRVGVTGGASRDSLSLGSRDSWGRETSTWLGALAGYDAGAFRLRGGIAYAWDQIPSNREVSFPGYTDRLTSSASGSTFTGFIEGAWMFKVGRGEISPFLNLADTRAETDAGTETGGAAALNAAEGAENVNFSTLGARGQIDLARRLNVHGALGWQRAFGDTTPDRQIQFATGGLDFTEYGVPIAKNVGVGRIGIGWHQGDFALNADYEGLSGSGVKDQVAKLSASITF